MQPDFRYAELLAAGCVVNHYQPITDLRTGSVLGVEVLGRLHDGTALIMPGDFLPSLDAAGLERLLMVSLPQGLALLRRIQEDLPDFFMSFNLSPRHLLRQGAVGELLGAIDAAGIGRQHVVLEVLESDEFLDESRHALAQLYSSGVLLALDDVGAGYSSLARMHGLAVHKIKLDQSFVRDLTTHPEGLHFVASMLSLARGLRKTLVVEGLETEEVIQALTVLGVEAAQGYGIARPMPADRLAVWLDSGQTPPASREPATLLGAYAAHLSIVEALRAVQNQPLKMRWDTSINDPDGCCVGQVLMRFGLRGAKVDIAHRAFHRVICNYATDPAAWEAATEQLWRGLQEAIREHGAAASPATVAATLPKRVCVAAGRMETPASA